MSFAGPYSPRSALPALIMNLPFLRHLLTLVPPPSLHRKLVIIGDGACGKTSLLSVFTLGYFPTVSRNTISIRSPLRLSFRLMLTSLRSTT